MDHAKLQELCESPALIRDEEELAAVSAHVETCEECHLLVDKAVTFDSTFFSPVRSLPRSHLSGWHLLGLKILHVGRDFTPHSAAEWHARTCRICREKYERSAWKVLPSPTALRWAVVAIIIVGFTAVLRFGYFRSEDTQLRTPQPLTLKLPADKSTIAPWQDFTWESPVSSAAYTLTIRDTQNGTTVLKQAVNHPFYRLTSDEEKLFTAGKQYEWWITVLFEKRELTSQHRTFIWSAPPHSIGIPSETVKKFQEIVIHGSQKEQRAATKLLGTMLEKVRQPSADSAWIHQTLGDLNLELREEAAALLELRTAVREWDVLGKPDLYRYVRALINLGFAAED